MTLVITFVLPWHIFWLQTIHILVTLFRLQWMQWIGCNAWKGKFVALLWMHQTVVIVTSSSALQPSQLLKVSKLKNCLCKSKGFYIVFMLNLLRPFQDHCQSKSNMALGQHVLNPNQLTSNVLIVSHQNHWDNCAESHCKQTLTTWINETLQIVIFIAELSIYFGLFLSWNCWTVAMTPCNYTLLCSRSLIKSCVINCYVLLMSGLCLISWTFAKKMQERG